MWCNHSKNNFNFFIEKKRHIFKVKCATLSSRYIAIITLIVLTRKLERGFVLLLDCLLCFEKRKAFIDERKRFREKGEILLQGFNKNEGRVKIKVQRKNFVNYLRKTGLLFLTWRPSLHIRYIFKRFIESVNVYSRNLTQHIWKQNNNDLEVMIVIFNVL